MANDSSKIVGTHGIKMYDAPFLIANAMPTPAAYGTAWGTPYIDLGYSDGGMHINWRRQFTEWNVDQETIPVLRTPETFDIRYQANLAQYDLAILQTATQQQRVTATPLSTTPAASGTRGFVDYEVGATEYIVYRSTGFEALNPGDGESVLSVAWRTIPMGDIALAYGPRPPGAQVNYEAALTPDTSVTPARVSTMRDIIPALP